MRWPARHAGSFSRRNARGPLLAGAARVRARGALRAEPRAARLVVALGMLLQAGCDRTMTEDDCRRVGEAMRAAWAAEVKKAAPEGHDRSGKAAVVLEREGGKLASEWTSDCKRELAGRPVDASEIDCISRSTTLDELSRCAAQ